MNNINECCKITKNNNVEWHTVRYLVKTMLNATIPPHKIIEMSRTMVEIFGVKSTLEAERAVGKCLQCEHLIKNND